jgi:hypothetical protein
MKPISPEEVDERFKHSIPDIVIECFNNIIVDRWNPTTRSAKFPLKDISMRIENASNYSSKQIYDNHWLDVENIFRDAGWKVEYDSPGYNETYEASFTFSRGK